MITPSTKRREIKLAVKDGKVMEKIGTEEIGGKGRKDEGEVERDV